MNSKAGTPGRLNQGLRRLLREVEAAAADLSVDQALFLVGLDGHPPGGAEDWLKQALRPRGRVLWSFGPGPGPGGPNPAPPRPKPAGVGPEEKSILWGK